MIKRRFAILGMATAMTLGALSACSGHSVAGGDVLEPVEATATPKPEEGTTNSPAYERLMQVFKNLGYEGIGLQYESEETLDLLTRVFSDPRAEGRQIRLVYTGLHMAYDSRHESLTVGGTSDFDAIIAFITKKVPQAAAKAQPHLQN